MPDYSRALELEVDRAYRVAEEARRVGLDPELTPEIPRAHDMASRVEKLLSHLELNGIADEIRTLCRDHPREEVALILARRLATDPERPGSPEARLDRALRVGLAILTEGILVAPLEGLAEVHLRASKDGGSYVELYYAGPIRAAGGTAQAVSVLLADVVRRELGLAAFQPDSAEVERYKEEIPLYKHFQHLQYVPSAVEIDLVVRNVPVCISGESTEGDAEVSAWRDLPRVATNGIRGGACLVIAEGLCQKAAKLRKIIEKLGLSGWEFLDRLGRAKSDDDSQPSAPKYLAEALGGRPILAYPNRPGGFRLAYGRARTAGLASCAVNPATMVLLRNFVAIGTQVKLEYPGKATAMAVCDTVEGPTVELVDGTVTVVHDAERAKELLPRVERILDLGTLLVPFGEFLENNRALVPSAYTPEWHREELRAAGVPEEAIHDPIGYVEALDVAHRWNVPLHPRFLLFWHDLAPESIAELSRFVETEGRWDVGRLLVPVRERMREHLHTLGFLGRPRDDGQFVGEPVSSWALLGGLGLAQEDGVIVRRVPLEPLDLEPLALVSRLAGVDVRARAPSRVGARVGRPEKARQRMMSPNVHGLFPVGESGGPKRSIPQATRSADREGVTVTLGTRRCPSCGRGTIWLKCPCGGHTLPIGKPSAQRLPVASIWNEAVERLALRRVPPEVKGVKGLTSPTKVPEILDKAILRAVHGVSIYQDGTARFDLTDLPLTHFRPSEVGLSVDSAKALGYEDDWSGAPLTRDDQLLELRPQDLIVSRSCVEYLLHLAQFVDDELVHLYHVEPYYRATELPDLIGQLVVALAPHTSGGVAGRLIGFTEAEACFAHPVFHAAKRRNCDGDEDSVTLLLDALLNFSRAYLPESRGALMDKPLVLTTQLDVSEVDKEALNLDVVARYPLELYRAAAERRPAKEVEPLIETIGRRASQGGGVSGLAFTHDTSDIAGAPVRSAYREAGGMDKGVERALALTAQIRAVDLSDAVALVLNAHFLPDLMGNLKSYATQKFRCKVCGTSYRRPPLTGKCSRPAGHGAGLCDGDLLPTVYEGAVRKYLGLSQRLAETPGITPYLRQRIEILERSLGTIFPAGANQATLDEYTPVRAASEPKNTGPMV